MKKSLFILILSASAVFPKVGVIINKDLIQSPYVKSAVDTYISDLLATGEQVWVDSTTFDDGNTRVELQQLRDSLRIRFLYDDIAGAVLIGNLPCASFELWNKNYIRDNSGNIIDSIWSGETYPIDYYFMNIDDISDTAWYDTSNESTHPTDLRYPYLTDYFDGYNGDDTMEIWVSRIIAHSLYHTCNDSILDDDSDGVADPLSLENPFAEDSVIVSYLHRVHNRITTPNTISERALTMGDFKNFFTRHEDESHIENHYCPVITRTNSTGYILPLVQNRINVQKNLYL